MTLWKRALAAIAVGAAGALAMPLKPALVTPPPFEYVQIDPAVAGDCKAVGDLDGDGKPDLVVGGFTSEKLNWYRNPDWHKTVIATPAVEFTTDCALGDVDADGDLDIVVPDGPDGVNLVWYANPRPTGDPLNGPAWLRHPIGAVGGWGKDVYLDDFDADGRLDAASRRDGAAMLFFQDTGGAWTAMTWSGVVAGEEGMTIGDVNGDGATDVVLQGVWLRNPGGSTARQPAQWTQHTIGPADPAFKALVADVDGDGQADVVFSSSEHTADVAWWRAPDGDPTGLWTKHVVLPGLAGAHTLQAADMDQDGALDLVIAQMHTTSEKAIRVAYNRDGAGTDWEFQVVAASGLHNGVVADINADGFPDLFGANWAGNPPVKLWLNGWGAIEPPPTLPPPGDARAYLPAILSVVSGQSLIAPSEPAAEAQVVAAADATGPAQAGTRPAEAQAARPIQPQAKQPIWWALGVAAAFGLVAWLSLAARGRVTPRKQS